MSLPDLRVEFRTTQLQGSVAQRKAHLEEYLVRICDVMNIERREPDKWEALHVFSALGALQAGLYGLAEANIDLAMAPPEERSEYWREPKSDVTRQQLEHAIQTERQRPPVPNAWEK